VTDSLTFSVFGNPSSDSKSGLSNSSSSSVVSFLITYGFGGRASES